MGGFRARFPYQPHARHTSFCPYNPPSSAYIFVPEIELDQFYVGEERAPATMIEGKQQMISHIQDLESWYHFEILGGAYRLCRPSGLLPCLHTSQNLTWLLIWRILFRQASCARAAECRIADCLSLSWLQLQDLNCLLDLACCLIWIVALEESW